MNLVIGYPLAHSLSPSLHNFVYGLENIPTKMVKFEEVSIEKIINKIKNENVLLTAVTMPLKEKVIDYLDEVETVAVEIGSVNTIVNRQGKLFGYNTDILGVKQALANVEIKNKKVLLLGAGGAARAVAYFLRKNFCQAFIYNRTLEKAEEIVDKFGGKAVADLAKVDGREIQLVVNCTPVGMGELNKKLPLPEKILNKNQIVFDLIYNPAETALLSKAEAIGAPAISGLEMFVGQGLEQINLAYGLKNDRVSLRRKIRKELIKYCL